MLWDILGMVGHFRFHLGTVVGGEGETFVSP